MKNHLQLDEVLHETSGMPTLEKELIDTFKGIVVDDENPGTVLHALLHAHRADRALTAAEITGITGVPNFRVERTLAVLGVSGWTTEFPENGFTKYFLSVTEDKSRS